VRELAVIIVSHNSAAWLPACLRSLYAHAGEARLDVVVVDNESGDGSAELVEREFPRARVVRAANRGFAYGNNRGLEAVSAPFVLLLNPDTEILSGSLDELVAAMERSPRLGIAGCRQLKSTGGVHPTIRRFPSVARTLFEALGSERYPLRARWLGERELDPGAYDRETSCDWISGSFMLARREAIEGVGGLDERYFLYCEETDLCLRVRREGWEVRHLPQMTILHSAHGSAAPSARLVAQEAYARRQYIGKNVAAPRRQMMLAALVLGHLLRVLGSPGAGERRRARRAGSRAALATLLGRCAPPFGAQPPGTPRDSASAGALGGTAGN
jgi:N-acetylglucosaminyl-diphospho-decaprenol L-rhamnosyltransferase